MPCGYCALREVVLQKPEILVAGNLDPSEKGDSVTLLIGSR